MKTNRIMQNAERKTQQAAGSRQQAAGSKQQAAGGQASGVRVQESGVRGQEAGVRSQESGVRSQSVPPSALHSSFIIHHSSFSASASARQRRGVLILVVLSLLVMFALMALTYVLVANKFLSKSKLDARAEANATNPQKEIESAFLQLIRDTSNEHSAMRGHALLPDEYGEPAQFWNSTLGIIQYGPNSVKGYIGTPFNPLAGNQLIDFVATYPANMSPSLIEGYYEGSVITMTTGVARGLSSRIVRYYNGSNQQHFRVVAFKGSSGPVVPNPGDEFLINGRAFTGTGTGFNSATGHLDARDSKGREFALLPNAAHYDPLGGDYDQGTPNVADDPMDFPFGGLGGRERRL